MKLSFFFCALFTLLSTEAFAVDLTQSAQSDIQTDVQSTLVQLKISYAPKIATLPADSTVNNTITRKPAVIDSEELMIKPLKSVAK